MIDEHQENLEIQTTESFDWKKLAKPLLLLVLILAIVVFFISRSSPSEVVEDIREQKSVRIFENLNLEAKAVFIWDVRNQKEIYSRNSEAQLHLASLTKVMMAVTALDQLPAGTIITIGYDDLSEEGDSGLLVNERWTLKDLIEFSLLVSSNDGAMAIASAVGAQLSDGDDLNVFIGLMNKKARAIGLSQTYFINPSGLDMSDVIPGGSGSAKDIALLFEYALREYPSVLDATSYPSVHFNSASGLSHKAENTNELVSKLPGIIASKTGFTDIAGGNLAIAFEPEPGRPIIVVVLGSSLEGRFDDIEKLYLTTLEYIN